MGTGLRSSTRRNGLGGWTDYATAEEFESLFESKREPLLRLALLLTASSEKAAQSLSFAMRDCRLSGSVAPDWILTWARRAIVRNAIQLVFAPVSASATQTLNDAGHDGKLPGSSTAISIRTDVPSIMKLPDFERLVYVITVLERSSIQDCALLMARSPKEVQDAQQRAIAIASLLEHHFNVHSEDGTAEVGDTCGKLIED